MKRLYMHVFPLLITIACSNIVGEKLHPAAIFEPALLLISDSEPPYMEVQPVFN